MDNQGRELLESQIRRIVTGLFRLFLEIIQEIYQSHLMTLARNSLSKDANYLNLPQYSILRKKILDSIKNDIFNTSDAKLACEQYDLKNWKGFLKDTRIIIQLHKGTNQSNPSIYKKV